MSFADRLLLWLHVAFVIFTLGPVTAAAMATPRVIRAKNVPVLTYLARTTRIFGVGTLGLFLFGLVLARGELSKAWITISMTLYVVGAVLLVLVARDQSHAIKALQSEDASDDAKVQTARIAMLGGVMSLIWLVVLILMIWNQH